MLRNMASELGMPVLVRFDDIPASADIHTSCFAQMLWWWVLYFKVKVTVYALL